MASESLRNTGGAGLSAEEYKALVLVATGSERVADELTRQREAKALRDAPIHGGE